MSLKQLPHLLLLFFFCFTCLLAAEDSISLTEDVNVVNVTVTGSNNNNRSDSFAGMLDRALEKEFNENDDEQSDATDPGSFNNSVAGQQAVLETVARVKSKRNESKEEKSFQLHDVFNLDNENRPEDTPRLIDSKDNVFIMSNPKSKYPVLQLDLRLISDLVVVIVSATCGGIAFACAGQPVITGYLLAGSLIGPGGLSFVNELVQVETVAQFGVIFLLFALGLEFSAAKLRVVRTVAILGGLVQIFLFMCLSGVIAVLCGGEASEGVFVGAFLSMSSTAVVLKFLMEKNSITTLYGQVTVGTLILQDCAVGLLFALLPILGGTSGIFEGMLSMAKTLVTLITFLAVLSVFSRTCIPWFFNLMMSLSSQTNELYQLASVAFCLIVASCSDKLGLSLELGSFAAGVMISTTDLAHHTLEQVRSIYQHRLNNYYIHFSFFFFAIILFQVEPIRNFFAALFLASIGMLIHVQFLWNHIDILLAAVILVVVIKTFVVATVVKGFGYTNKTALLVGMSLAQIGEFAFVLLSRASNLHLIEGKLYLLLLGTTALSLVTTPFLFKLIPAVVHLGVLLRWFTPDIPTEMLKKGELMRSDTAKRISLMAVPDAQQILGTNASRVDLILKSNPKGQV
ncbi:K(+) efflux antiporter 4-like isoform X1 [Bidens hawaiensis]|uniref:K(+) efflux antiporter 4-like isoform X1 n=2 Tax=Bidens hawaiensis TaxID=980011 RepID=UPI00404B03E8